MIAISCPGFSMTPFSEMIEAIAPHFESWEIIAEGLHTMADIEDDVTECKDSYDMELTVHAPFSDLNIASLNPRIRESSIAQVIEAIRISSGLGIRLISLHPGHRSPLGAYFPEKVKEVHKKSLRRIDKAREEYGVSLALENMPKMWISLCSYAQEIAALIEGTGLKICFDLGHANISGDINGFLGLKHSFANVHLHDNDGRIDRHLVLGEGNINIEMVEDAVANSSRFDIFELVDTALSGDGVRTSRIIDGLRGEGIAAAQLSWALVREIRTLAAMAAAVAVSDPVDAVLRQYRVWQKRQAPVRAGLLRHNAGRWQQLLKRAGRVDRIIKGAESGNPWDELLQLSLMMAGIRLV